jgi:hypothetical protein
MPDIAGNADPCTGYQVRQLRLEDVKKSTWPKFRSIQLDAKCKPTPQRSFMGHLGAIFFKAETHSTFVFDFFTPSCPLNFHAPGSGS